MKMGFIRPILAHLWKIKFMFYSEQPPPPSRTLDFRNVFRFKPATVSLSQPPSKVVHLSNLPWECTEDELIELGKPFGSVVNTKCNVGANRNQAFIEFEDLNQAIQMISYYASSSDPAQVRGKTVYLQYSNRQEIVNNKTSADIVDD